MSSGRKRSSSIPVTRQEKTSNFLTRQVTARKQSLAAMQNTGLVASRTQQLKMSTISWGAGTEGLAAPSQSAHFNTIKSRLGDKGLETMFKRNARVKPLMDRIGDHPDAIKPERIVSHFAESSGRFGKLKVNRHPSTNAFNWSQNEISLIDPTNEHYAAHEMRHAYDHHFGKLDMTIPEHRLTSELNAFGTQIKVATELGVDAGLSGRSALEQARTYEGKPSYPGTLDSSFETVRKWKQDQ